MHEPVRSRLEDILQGRMAPGDKALVREHLAGCKACTAELGRMSVQAEWVRSLRVDEGPEPMAGFYARVMQRVEAQGRPTFWSLLLDPVFGRRMMYATGTMFLLMASLLLATTGEQPELARTPVEVMARPAVTPVSLGGAGVAFGEDVQRDRDHFLATMASFTE